MGQIQWYLGENTVVFRANALVCWSNSVVFRANLFLLEANTVYLVKIQWNLGIYCGIFGKKGYLVQIQWYLGTTYGGFWGEIQRYLGQMQWCLGQIHWYFGDKTAAFSSNTVVSWEI